MPFSARLIVLALAGTALAGTTVAQARVTLYRDQLPGKLVFPFPEGEKAILRAEIAGARPRSVWLAVEKDAKVRIMLREHADGKHRIDLADPVVHTMLRAAGRRRQFRVFAETEQGIAESPPLRYELRGGFVGRLRYRLYQAKQEDPEGLTLSGTHWYAPDRVRRIEVAYGESWPVPKADAHSGELCASLRHRERLRLLVLDVTQELAEEWSASGRIEIHVQQGEWRARPLRIHAIPRRISYSGNKVSVSVVQRGSAELPASNGYLFLCLGDITRGQVLAEIQTIQGDVVLSKRSMRKGDRVRFRFGDREYQLVVEQLVNKLIGKDYGVFAITDPGLGDLDRIELMLKHIAAQSVTFIREGKDHDAKAAAAHLRRKFEHRGPKIRTLDEFIQKIASRSSTTGNPYRIRLTDGRTVSAGDWLLAQKKRLAENGWKLAQGEDPATRR